MTDDERLKSLLTPEQFTTVFGFELGAIQRYVKLGMPFETISGKKYYNLVSVTQWILSHFKAGNITLNECAELFGVEPRTITLWVNSFGMPKAASGNYRIKDVVLWREKYLGKKIKELQQGGADGVSAATWLKKEQAERQRLKRLQEQRVLVVIDEIMPFIIDALVNLKINFQTFGQTVAPQIEGMNINERAQRIQQAINERLAEVSELPDTLKRAGVFFEQQTSGGIQSTQTAAAVVGKPTRSAKKNSQSGIKSRSGKVSVKHSTVSSRNDGRGTRSRG